MTPEQTTVVTLVREVEFEAGNEEAAIQVVIEIEVEAGKGADIQVVKGMLTVIQAIQ